MSAQSDCWGGLQNLLCGCGRLTENCPGIHLTLREGTTETFARAAGPSEVRDLPIVGMLNHARKQRTIQLVAKEMFSE